MIQRASYAVLCASPFLAIALAANHALRIPRVHHLIGAAVFTLSALAVWTLARRAISAGSPEARLAAIAGTLLVAPFCLVALLWVGLGPPSQATATENQMRYVVLIAMAIAVVSGYVALKEALSLAGERIGSTLGFVGIVLAGPLYVIGEALLLAAYSALERSGRTPEVFVSLSELQDILLFFAGALTYSATAAFAISLGQVGWLGRAACRTFAGISVVALSCLVARGLQFPDPATPSTAWYSIPGFVVGIPAVPFVIPCLFGAVLLRHVSQKEARVHDLAPS